jgi:hypothetical protein
MSPPDGGDYFTVDGERPALVDPGVYSLRYLYYETARLHAGRAGKVIAWFQICDLGPHFEKHVARYYNATVPSSKRQRGGKFKVGWHSHLMREYGRVESMPQRADRLRLDSLARHLLEGRIATVTVGHDQRSIPKALQYSVVAEITGVRQRGC